MATNTYERLILEGIKGLPSEALSEIADFIYFVRRRTPNHKPLRKNGGMPY